MARNELKIGLAKSDITPRVGVELCGFGPFRHRYSTSVRDRLWARAMVLEHGGRRAVVIGCDLIGTAQWITDRVRRIVSDATGVPADAVMVASSHTHSAPCTGPYIGWGEPDAPYLETLPRRIAKAAVEAAGVMQPAELSRAEVPCEGIGLNREYDRDAPPLADVLRDDWRPAKPELTDTTCHVLRIDAGGKMIGFASYFGCHPVVCCAQNHQIHGDYCGVATNLMENENSGAVGLFFQGAQGDVNSCVVHKAEQESLAALDVIAARYAAAVRRGLTASRPIAVDALRWARRQVTFTRKDWPLAKLRQMLAEKESLVQAADSDDQAEPANIRMETVYLLALRQMVAAAEAGRTLSPPLEMQSLRIGPIALLGSGFEIFQTIKNDVKARARSEVPLVTGLVNNSVGYAPDRTAAARGGYAADMVPLICGSLPFANIHDELVTALLDLDAVVQ